MYGVWMFWKEVKVLYDCIKGWVLFCYYVFNVYFVLDGEIMDVCL